MNENYLNELEQLLSKNDAYTVENKVNKNKVAELAHKYDPELIDLLAGNVGMRRLFFVETAGKALVFNKDKFIQFISNKEFLPDSYTSYKNKIGLGTGTDLLAENKEVVLNWPYKDCVLEGGQDKEDTERNEVLFNEVLAPDQIDRLLDEKVLTGWKRYDKHGKHDVSEFTETDSLIIRGNNLLALHSLKRRYGRKIKVIYIDPPYNPDTQSNTFIYNNRFNHSTWLTFMKNRLQVAKELMTTDGVLIVAIDDNEFYYLGVMLKEIFKESETHCITIVHNPRGIQGTNFSYTHEYAFFVIPKGLKSIGNRKIDDEEVSWRNLRDNGGESLRTDARNCFYPIIVKDGKIVGFGDIANNDFHPASPNVQHSDGTVHIYPIDPQGIERKWRYARQSVEKVKELLRTKESKSVWQIEIGKDFGMYRTVWIDNRYDANEYGTKLVKSLVPDTKFDFPKSLWNVYDCLYAVIQDDKNAIVLDFFAGSGTTAHAVLELNRVDGGNRKFILTEQMGYIEDVTVPRVHNVIKNNGLETKFVYAHLMDLGNRFVEKVKHASSDKEIENLLEQAKKSSFLSYKVDPEKINPGDKDFTSLSMAHKKQLLLELVDQNHLYVNYAEIDDVDYGVSADDKKLNKQFYEK